MDNQNDLADQDNNKIHEASSSAQPVLPTGHQATSTQPTNSLAIASLVAAFFVPLLGFVLSLVALSQIKKKGEQGKGLAVAALITSVLIMLFFVVSVALALIIFTFSAIQSKARDAERTTDITSLHAHLETYYGKNGAYPSLTNMNDPNFRSTHFKSLDTEALRAPTGHTAQLSTAQSLDVYTYTTYPANCGNPSSLCTIYSLGAVLEDGTFYVRQSPSQTPVPEVPLRVEDHPFDGSVPLPQDDIQSSNLN